ncbi:MAG: alpha-glucan family phosphorylase, partial [Thermoanaerobaculia bacterium]
AGVGLLYRQGYFHQTLDADGRQQHFYPTYDFTRLPMRPATDEQGRSLEVSVPLPDRDVTVRVWLAQVGRVPLLLLDSDVTRNDPADRVITNQLYVQGREMRLIQELVLGVGGARALAALGIEPAVWHANEGHCSLFQLERLARARADTGSWEAALEAVRPGVAFTTHTPVPAGNERFDVELARRYLTPWATLCEVEVDRLLDLGNAEPAGTAQESFNLSVVGLRTSRTVNAVSRRNAEVVREMWRPLRERHLEVPDVTAVTNGVHTSTWVGPEIGRLFTERVGADWRQLLLEPARWRVLLEADDEEVWRAHRAQKVLLGRFLENRLREQFARHGASPDELRRVKDIFDPDALIIGFARRFATYKRAHLLFSDLDRLTRIISSQPEGVQVVVAGKAHPADQEGQELIRRVFQLGSSPELGGRIVFLEDYDLRVAKMLVQGVDVWLNTPRPPLEASGTSGQKAALNGALNLSVLDGWWPEAFDGEHGWALGAETDRGADAEEQDRADAESLYSLLETDVLPLFGRRDAGLPHEWIGRMKRAMAAVTPAFSSHRMLADYVERIYAVAAGSPSDPAT